jgi:hypothetical protein
MNTIGYIAANDPSNMKLPGDLEAACMCGFRFFKIVLRDGLHYVICAQCQHDHTMTTIWAKGSIECVTMEGGDAQRRYSDTD